MPLFGSESTTNQISTTHTIDKKIGAEDAQVYQNDGGGDLIITETPDGAFDLAEASVLAVTMHNSDVLKMAHDNAAMLAGDAAYLAERFMVETGDLTTTLIDRLTAQSDDAIAKVHQSTRSDETLLADKLVTVGIPAAILILIVGRFLK